MVSIERSEWTVPEPACLSCFTVWGDYIYMFHEDGTPNLVIAENAGDDVCEECHSFGLRQSRECAGCIEAYNQQTSNWELI